MSQALGGDTEAGDRGGGEAAAPGDGARSPAATSVPRRRGSWASSPTTRRVMQSNRKRDTQPELALRSAAHRSGLRYRVCAPPVAGVHRTADLLFRGARVAVFVDGCFWHGCPDHYRAPATNPDYWVPKIERNRARDRDTEILLVAEGWTVLRVWEHEGVETALDRIRAALGRPRPDDAR